MCILEKTSSTHNYNTRGARCNLFVNGKNVKSLKYIAPKFWNVLDQDLRGSGTISTFKRRSKEGFLLGYSKFKCGKDGCYSCKLWPLWMSLAMCLPCWGWPSCLRPVFPCWRFCVFCWLVGLVLGFVCFVGGSVCLGCGFSPPACLFQLMGWFFWVFLLTGSLKKNLFFFKGSLTGCSVIGWTIFILW